jgi:hypothetical protein
MYKSVGMGLAQGIRKLMLLIRSKLSKHKKIFLMLGMKYTLLRAEN